MSLSVKSPVDPVVSDTRKRGTLSENRKNCLDLANIKAKGQPRGIGRFSNSPEARAAKPSDEKTTLRLAEAPSPEALPREASDGLPILRFARGPAHKASDETPILRLARGRLGNNLVASVSIDFSDKTSRVQPLPQRQPHIGAVQRSGRRDGRQDWAGVTGHCARHYAHN